MLRLRSVIEVTTIEGPDLVDICFEGEVGKNATATITVRMKSQKTDTLMLDDAQRLLKDVIVALHKAHCSAG